MRRTTTIALLFAALAVASASMAQESECSSAGFVPQLLTPAAGHLPRDGALVVGLVPGGSDTSGQLPAVSLTRRRLSIPLHSETIAPGLFRLVPESPRRLSGRFEISGLNAPPLYFRRSALPPPPAKPVLERAERYLVAGEEPRLEVRGHFAFPLPTDVVAIISAWDEDGTPAFWVRSSPTQRSIVLFASRPCGAALEGASAPPESGGQVRVAFVDRHGQVSPMSEPRTIE